VELLTAFDRALSAQREPGALVGSELQEAYRERYRDPQVVEAVTFWGESMRVVLPELVSCELHRYGLIEPGLTRAFIELIEPGMVVYDVGAHLGYHSLLASRLGAVVHAFEPAPATLPLLKHNLGGRAIVEERGVWAAPASLQLKDYGAGHSAVNTFLEPADDELGEPETTHEAELTTIDRYARETGAMPGFIKLDVEGAELQVLRGAAETIAAVSPVMTVEVGDTARDSREVLEHAIASGYDAFEMSPSGIDRHVLRDRYGYDNILLIPRSSDRAGPGSRSVS